MSCSKKLYKRLAVLVGLIGANEDSTVGVGKAIKAAGSKVIGIGFDKHDAILGLLKDGSL